MVALAVGCRPHGAEKSHGKESEAAEKNEPTLYEIVLRDLPPEASDGATFTPPSATFYELLERLSDLEADPQAKGIFLRVESFGGGFARAQEFAIELNRIKAKRSWPVHCHFDVADNTSYALLASVCDRISMGPSGDLNFVGLAANMFHARKLLENIGARADLMQMGKYKGAEEPVTRDDSSPEYRETLTGVLTDLEKSLVLAVQTGRHLDEASTIAAIDAGPFGAEEALKRKLIDARAFDDEARRIAKEAAHASRVEKFRIDDEPKELGLSELLHAFEGKQKGEKPEGKHLALVILDGEIHDGEDASGGSGVAGPFIRKMRSLADDKNVLGVVLRINSPGGSALASDRMWHAVRRVVERKPVFVSIGGMAASGGYYIASAAPEIDAMPASIIGSIGVVGGKIVVADLLQRVGITHEVISLGKHAAWTDPTRPFTDEERKVLGAIMHDTYDRFVDRVSQGRSMDRAKVEAVAEGRLWSGDRGKENGLLNESGLGFAEVIRRAKAKAGLPEDAKVEVWPSKKTFLDVISNALHPDEDEAIAPVFGLIPDFVTRVMLARFAPAAAEALSFVQLWLGDEHVQAVLPMAFEIH